MRNVCGPNHSFCFVDMIGTSPASIAVVEVRAPDGDNPME